MGSVGRETAIRCPTNTCSAEKETHDGTQMYGRTRLSGTEKIGKRKTDKEAKTALSKRKADTGMGKTENTDEEEQKETVVQSEYTKASA